MNFMVAALQHILITSKYLLRVSRSTLCCPFSSSYSKPLHHDDL